MGNITHSRQFMRQRVDILRPAIAIDVTTIRDKILTNYVVIQAAARCYMEPIRSERVMNSQLGGIAVDTMAFFFPKNTIIAVNDVLKEAANYHNGQVIRYFDVVGVLRFSQYDSIVRVDANLKNYHRQ